MATETSATGNRVISAYTAIVGGEETGLAGCSNSSSCSRTSNCLRADSALKHRAVHKCEGSGRYFINRAPNA